MLSFIDYYNSKQVLLEAVKSSLVTYKKHTFSNYATIPLYRNAEEIRLKLKNGMILESKWTQLTPELCRLDSLIVDGKEFQPYWNTEKMIKWLSHNSTEIY